METAGWTVLRVTWSDRLRQGLGRMNRIDQVYRLIREAYDGLPMRIAHEVAGELIFSSARLGVTPGWFRDRTDLPAGGACDAFVPGLSIAGPLGPADATLSVISGSARLDRETAPPDGLALQVRLAAGDVVMLDSRALRMWSEPEGIFQLAVVRPWIEPEQDISGAVDESSPARAVRFAGLPTRPSRSYETWLFDRHERRSGEARLGEER